MENEIVSLFLNINNKTDMIMKSERKFTWCVRCCDVRTGVVDYRVFNAL